MSLINVTKGSSSISAEISGVSGIPYTVSNGVETIENLLTGETVSFDNLDPLTGYTLTISRDYIMVKSIKVKGTTKPLSISELRAWLWTGDLVRNTGTATQSSTAYGGVASKALDLSNSLGWGGGSVTHTNGGSDNWWRWDFTEALPITKVTFWGRKDCCQFRQDGAIMMVYDSNGDIITQRTIGTTKNGQSLTVQV